MADVKWIKISTGTFSESRKIRQIEQMPEGDTILVIWLKLMLLAGQINDGGAVYVTPELPYTEEMLAIELGRPLQSVKLALMVFERFGMVRNENGVLVLTSWEKYQNIDGLEKIREQSRERKQRQRERDREKKLLKCETDVSRDSHATVTRRHAIEKEIEEEIDKEEEKEGTDEFRSCAHSLFEVSDAVDPTPEDPAQAERTKRRKLGGNLGRGVVMLSDEQMDHLLEILSAEEFDHYVSVIAENELNGKHYSRRTHYQAILDMAKIDRHI